MARGFGQNRKRSSLKLATLDTNKYGIKPFTGTKHPGIKPLSQVVELSRPNAEFYNSVEWKELSDMFRTNNPFCFRCGKTVAEGTRILVDHIVEINDDPSKRSDPHNLQCLCYSCHSIKSFQERKKRLAREMSC